jgi:hypothetical protein
MLAAMGRLTMHWLASTNEISSYFNYYKSEDSLLTVVDVQLCNLHGFTSSAILPFQLPKKYYLYISRQARNAQKEISQANTLSCFFFVLENLISQALRTK